MMDKRLTSAQSYRTELNVTTAHKSHNTVLALVHTPAKHSNYSVYLLGFRGGFTRANAVIKHEI